MFERFLKFLKIYLIFMASALAINLSLEMLIPTPEAKEPVGIIIFYLMFNLMGSLIFLRKNYSPKKMGILSLVIGFIFEFSFMRPDWVLNIYAGDISANVIFTVIISAVYWFIPWSVPAFVIRKFLR